MRSAADSSVSPKSWRRSECATSVPPTPMSLSIHGDTSPVYGPSFAQCVFCAKTPISVTANMPTASCSDGYGGHTITSAPSKPCSLARRRAQNSRVSSGPLYIFQLPAISIGQASGIAATPGSSLPSSSSSDAPPPVETQSTRSARPASCSARAESAPPTTV